MVRLLHEGLTDRAYSSHVLGLSLQHDIVMKGASSLQLRSPYDPRALGGIWHYLRNNCAAGDVVHVHLFPPLLYVSILASVRHFDYHLVCTEHSTSNRRRGKTLGRIIDALTYRAYRRIVAISQATEDALVTWQPTLSGKTVVIHNGIDLLFKESITRPQRPTLKVVSVGNLSEHKNYEAALHAVSLLPELNFEYHVAGDGPRKQHLLELTSSLNLHSRVRFLGYVTDTPTLLASSDILLMPSKWEGFGLAALEAMNASLPLVVSDVPGLREVISSENTCAITVDPTSPQSIAGGIRTLIQSRELRLEFGHNGFERSLGFSQDKMVRKHLELYNEIIDN